MRKGDLINGKTVSSFIVLPAMPAMPAIPGQTRFYNQTGEAIVRVTSTDNTQGLVEVTVP
jgi:hypothetical protein